MLKERKASVVDAGRGRGGAIQEGETKRKGRQQRQFSWEPGESVWATFVWLLQVEGALNPNPGKSS